MYQLNSSSNLSSHTVHNTEEELFTYNGSTVKIITVFSDSQDAVALVEDENGELFEVSKAALR